MALSSKLQNEALMVMDQFDLDQIKTKEVAQVLKTLNLKNVLLVTDQKDEKLERSSKNIPDVKVLRCDGLNVYDILAYEKLLLVAPAVKAIEGRLSA
jgi:large subunit ribosomal protein L4